MVGVVRGVLEERGYMPASGDIIAADDIRLKRGGVILLNPGSVSSFVPNPDQEEIARRGWALSAREATELVGQSGVVLIGLREAAEHERHGSICGSLHAPYRELQENIGAGGLLHELANATGKSLLFYWALASARRWRAATDDDEHYVYAIAL